MNNIVIQVNDMITKTINAIDGRTVNVNEKGEKTQKRLTLDCLSELEPKL